MLSMSCTKHINDNIFMQRCLQLAANGEGCTSPNPMVGAVIVYQGKIIGEGWHRQAGQPHAEPNAIHSVKNQELLKESTLYVSLEPCSHYGKTPPCADLIIEKQIPRVVVGCCDPFPKVSGRGIAKLQAAGIQVVTDVEKEACWMLNRKFFCFQRNKRPYILLKWAQTADGFTDICRVPNDGKHALKISDEYTSMIVHQLRSQVDAVMVGFQTAILDNPQLTVRNWSYHKQPVRIVFDRNGILSKDSSLLNGESDTLIFTQKKSSDNATFNQSIDTSNTHIGRYHLNEVLDELYQRNLQSLLVEGGSQLQNAFIAADLWDEIQIETSAQIIHTGHPAPTLPTEMTSGCVEHIYKSADGTRQIRSILRNFLC